MATWSRERVVSTLHRDALSADVPDYAALLVSSADVGCHVILSRTFRHRMVQALRCGLRWRYKIGLGVCKIYG